MRINSLRLCESRTAAVPSRRSRPVLAYLEHESVPANVQSARQWIAAWKQRQATMGSSFPSSVTQHTSATHVGGALVGKDAAPAHAHIHTAEVPPHVQEARQWIAAWKERTASPTAMAPAALHPAAEGAEVTHATVAAEVPPNVQDARNWIAAWKQRTAAGFAATASAAVPPAAGAVATETKGASVTTPTPKVAADGTITFCKAFLNSVDHEATMKALQQKAQRPPQ